MVTSAASPAALRCGFSYRCQAQAPARRSNSKGIPIHKMVLFFRMVFTVIVILPEPPCNADVDTGAHDRQTTRTYSSKRYSHIRLDPKVAHFPQALFEACAQIDDGERVLGSLFPIPGTVPGSCAGGKFVCIRVFLARHQIGGKAGGGEPSCLSRR